MPPAISPHITNARRELIGCPLFVGNLSYSTTEADLRAYFFMARGSTVPGCAACESGNGRPRGFAFVEFLDRANAETAIQRFNGQVFNGRPLAVSGPGLGRPRSWWRIQWTSSRRPRQLQRTSPGWWWRLRWASARRWICGPRPGGPGGGFGGPRPFDQLLRRRPATGTSAPTPNRSVVRTQAKKKDAERPRGPIPTKFTGRSFSLDDDGPDDGIPADLDDFANEPPGRRFGRRGRIRHTTRAAWCGPLFFSGTGMSDNAWSAILERLRTKIDPMNTAAGSSARARPLTRATRSPSGSRTPAKAATSPSAISITSIANSPPCSGPTSASVSSPPATTVDRR